MSHADPVRASTKVSKDARALAAAHNDFIKYRSTGYFKVVLRREPRINLGGQAHLPEAQVTHEGRGGGAVRSAEGQGRCRRQWHLTREEIQDTREATDGVTIPR